jgi:hypothetical protein
MASTIEVRVHGRGKVRGGSRVVDPEVTAQCDLCGVVSDVVVSTTPQGEPPFACKVCLRGRLEAITIAIYELKDDAPSGLPWGKISG